MGQNDSCGCFGLTQNNELESFIIPKLFPTGKGECAMFTRVLVFRKSFHKAGILNAAAMVFTLDLATFELTELTTKPNGATTIQYFVENE